MAQEPSESRTRLAEALLKIVPRLLRRLNADMPPESEADGTECAQGWRNVAELRATPGQLSLLEILVEHGRCTMQELAEHLAVTPPTATAMVKRLLAQGYVERAHDEADWRTVWVRATETGRQAVTVFLRARLASLESRLEHLSDEERASIIAALPALRHLIEV